MQQPFLELRERRELGTILSDSFTFIRINKTPLWNVLVRTSAVFFLLTIFLSGLYSYGSASSWMISNPFILLVVVFCMMFSSILFYASTSAGVYSFMKNYIETKGEVQEEVIVKNARSKIVHLVIISFISAVMLFIGFIFFVIPGVYLMTPLAMAIPVFCFQKLGKIDSIRAGFKLVSDHWWETFGTLLVIYIVFMIITFAFQLPSTIYMGGKAFFPTSGEPGDFSGDFIYLILSTISSAASNFISIIIVVCIGLVYLDLDEQKNRTGIKAKLEELG